MSADGTTIPEHPRRRASTAGSTGTRRASKNYVNLPLSGSIPDATIPERRGPSTNRRASKNSVELISSGPTLEQGTVVHHVDCFSAKDHVYIDIQIVKFDRAKYVEIIVFHPSLLAEAPRMYIKLPDLWFLIDQHENPFLTEKQWHDRALTKLWQSKVYIHFQKKRMVNFILNHIKLSNSNRQFIATLESDVIRDMHKKITVNKPPMIEAYKVQVRRRVSVYSLEMSMDKARKAAVMGAFDNAAVLTQVDREIQDKKREALRSQILSTFLTEPRYLRDAELMSRAQQRWLYAFDRVRIHLHVNKIREKEGLPALPSLNAGEVSFPSDEERMRELDAKRLIRIQNRVRFLGQIDGLTINRKIAFM